MVLTTHRTKGTRKGKPEKREWFCTIHKGIYQEKPANDHKENWRTPTKL